MQEANDFDVCIVGGGPGGLTALSALIEPFSVDHLSESPGERAAHALTRVKRSCPRVCVVDPEPWLSTWHTRFESLNIKWLRSPAEAHPDIFDKGSLFAFALNAGRQHDFLDSGALSSDLRQLAEGGSGLWNLPSNQLFEDFCCNLASCLPHTFIRGKVASVEGDDGNFNVCLTSGRQLKAKTVILALGVPGPAAVPASLADVPESLMFHSDDELGRRLNELKTKKHVLVIGGGLTAVQVAQLALEEGCTVVLVSRRPLVTRHFDVHEAWFDRRRAHFHHYNFFQRSIDERAKHIRAARGGGSVPPMYMKEVRKAEAEGRLVLKCCEVQLEAILPDVVDVLLDGIVHRFDLIVTACGHRPDCQQLPVINELLKSSPVDVVSGFPALSMDLQWGGFKQLFLIGALASLQVGPDAGNLMGLRRASQIVANVLNLRAWLKDTKFMLQNIRGNRFDVFESDSDSEDSATEYA